MNKQTEINESVIYQLATLLNEPENKHLCLDPISAYVKVGDGQMENN
jgi:hypothetical protein